MRGVRAHKSGATVHVAGKDLSYPTADVEARGLPSVRAREWRHREDERDDSDHA